MSWKFPRRFSATYCKKTPCKAMGFTQRASCRPYKNCYKRMRNTHTHTHKHKKRSNK